MTLLDVSIVNVALPSIETALHANADDLQWIVAGYALTFGLLLVAAGRAGDIFGRRRLFIIGLTGFVLASLGCGFAPNATWLTIMRLLQGASAGILNPQVLGIMQDLYKGRARARAFGVFGIVVGVSTALGPVIGGLLISLLGAEHGWRLVFLINVPIGMIVIPLAAKWLPAPPAASATPDTPAPGKTTSNPRRSLADQFDPVGVTVLGAIVLLIMWPFLASSGEVRNPNASGAPFWMLGVAAGLAVALIFWEHYWRGHGGSALLDPELMKSPSFMLGALAGFFYFAGFTSIFLVVTLYLQQGLGWTPLAAGLAAVPFAVISGSTSGISGNLVNRFGRVIPVAGSLIAATGMLGVAASAHWLTQSSAPWGVIGFMAFAGVGSGLFISPNQALTLEGVPRRLAGLAAALLQTFQRLGTAIGLSIVTTIYFVTVVRSSGGSRPEGAGSAAHAAGISAAAFAVSGILVLAVIANIADSLRRKSPDSQEVRSTIEGQASI